MAIDIGANIVIGRRRAATVSGGGVQPWYQNGSALANSLVALWKLDEASGARADSVGANTLTDNNTVMSNTGLVYPLAADFVAANSEYLSRASSAPLQTGDIDFWFAVWIFPTSVTGAHQIVSKDTDTGRDYLLSLSGSTVAFYVNGSILAQKVSVATLSAWQLIVAWHNAAADTVNVTHNNGTVGSGSTAGAVPATTAAEFQIGARQYPGNANYFDGRIGPMMMGKGYVPDAADRTWLYNGGLGRT